MSDWYRTLSQAEAPLPQIVDRVCSRLASWPAHRDELLQWGVHLRVTRSVAVRSCARYLDAASDFLEWLLPTGKDWGDIDRDLVDGWMEWLYVERRLAATSRDLMLIAVRSLLDWRALEHGGDNPARKVRGPRKPKREPRKLNQRQVQRLIAACRNRGQVGLRDLAMIVFMLSTGSRPGEMAALKLEQLDLSERVGRVRFFGKGSRERTVSFEGPAIKCLMEWLQHRDGLDLLDRSRVWTTLEKGKPSRPLTQRGLEHALERVAGRARVAFNPRMLRVTFATELYEARCDIEEIRKLLGHENINTTRRYLAVSDRMQKARIPARHMRRLIGDESGIPLWARERLGVGDSDDRTS